MSKKDEVKSVSQGRGLTPKQEKFCQKYIELGNASEAYRQVYNCSRMNNESVHRLAKKELDKIKIGARLEELKNTHKKRHNITVDKLVERLDRIYQCCISDDKPQYSVAMNAIMNQARLLGIDTPHAIELRQSLMRKYTLEGDKIEQELNHRGLADDKIQFMQEFE